MTMAQDEEFDGVEVCMQIDRQRNQFLEKGGQGFSDVNSI